MRQNKDCQELQECTFKPTINSKSDFYARRSRGCYLMPLADRLHHEADKRATLRHKAKELLQADEMCSHTFQPNINHRSPAQGKERERQQLPLHMRTEELRRQQAEKRQAAQNAEDERQECSFQPRISSRSERIVQKKRDDLFKSIGQDDDAREHMKLLGPVEDRLYAEAQALEQRRALRYGCSSDVSTSAPSVDEESKKICKNSVYFQGAQQDFLTRQQTFELARKRRMEVRTQHAAADCTFAPEISDVSRQLVSSNVDFIGETMDEKVNRLAVKDVARRTQLRGALEQLQYQECTFKPAINSTSHKLVEKMEEAFPSDCGPDAAAGVGVHQRLYRSTLASKSRVIDGSEADECTFKPQIDESMGRRFAHVRGRYVSDGAETMQNICADLERKEEQLVERRFELGEKERASCTFAPSVSRPYDEPHRPVVVSGLDRFFELRGLALRQQLEKQEREESIFNPETSRHRCTGVTIPEPFNLSRGPQDHRGW